jgi:hypothetical protein
MVRMPPSFLKLGAVAIERFKSGDQFASAFLGLNMRFVA